MGAVDLVVQVEAPPSVASGLQRVGRAGHQVGAVSARRGVPEVPGRPRVLRGGRRADDGGRDRVDALPAQPARRARPAHRRDGRLWSRGRSTTSPGSSGGRRRSPRCRSRRCTRCSTCSPGATRRRSSASCAPGSRGTASPTQLQGRPGAQRLAVTSGGTIPDRGLFTVMTPGGADGRGSRVGELDEEMVYESRVGDTFLLGTSSWTGRGHHPRPRDRHPGAGAARADAVLEGRAGRAAAGAGPGGRGVRAGDVGAVRARPRASAPRRPGSTSGPSTTCSPTCTSSARPPGTCPATARSSSSGSATSWATGGSSCTRRSGRRSTGRGALAIAARMRERRGVEVHASAADDGIVLRLPDAVDDSGAEVVPTAEDVLLDPAEVEQVVVAELGGSSLYASRFRECAARSLLLPRRDPRRRTPLWQQRQRAVAAARGGRALRAVPGHARGDARVRAGRLRPARACAS